MARRGFFRRARRSVGRAVRRRTESRGSGLTPMNVLLAGAVYGAARPFLASAIPTFFTIGPVDSDNVIIGAAGLYGMKEKGFLKALSAVTLGGEAGIVTARLTSSAAASPTAQAGFNAYNY